MERQTDEHDINRGEHAANDEPQIDWERYHENTPKLSLNMRKTRYETQKTKSKTPSR